MGCGSSSVAQPVSVVPNGAPSTGPRKVQVAHLAGGGLPSSGAGGLASFKAPGSAVAGTASRRGLHSEDELPPLKTTPKGTPRALPGVGPPGLALGDPAANAPAGSQIAGLNYCTAEFFPTHMEQCWNHYARAPDYKLIDKAGLKAMAEDAVASFYDSARRAILQDNPKWDDAKVMNKVNLLRGQFLPGSKYEDSVLISTHFLAHELKYQSGEDSRSSGVTKPCYFLHFQRAHRQLFSYTRNTPITLERELLVQKLNKQGVDRANKGLKSITAKGTSSGSSGGAGLSSQKGVRSVKASSRHKSVKTPNSKGGTKQERSNMFGSLDFSLPPPSESVAE